MVATLIDSSNETSKRSANVFEREKAGLFVLEQQLNALFFDLQQKYGSIFFTLERSGSAVDVSISLEETTGLLKIIREVIDNCVRHSLAHSVKAEVKLINYSLIQFSISDDGRGFDLDSVAKTKSYSGIKRICDCANQINARVVFHSNPGKGTQVVVAKPVEKQRARFYTRLAALF